MHYSAIPSSLLAFLLPALVVASPTSQSTCLHLKGDEMAAAAACGDKARLRECFAESSFSGRGTIEFCLVEAGCTHDKAAKEAKWIFEYCESEPEELKRRRPEAIAAATPLPDKNILNARATTTSSLVCSTDTQTTVQSCATDNTKSCSDVTTTTKVCAAGLICSQDAKGNNLCMVREDTLTTSGAIVSVFLGAVLAVTLTSLVFLCCRDKRNNKRMQAKAEAAAIAKESAASRPRPTAAAAAAVERHNSAAAGGANPFQDGNRM